MTTAVWKTVSQSFAAGLTLLSLHITAPAQAADYEVGAIHISGPWARATPKGTSSGAAYLTIMNHSSAPDRVTCVSSNASDDCQIHSVTIEGGIMKMRPVEGGLEIKPGEAVVLKPSGFHLMLVRLQHPLEPGKTVEATLKFEKAGTVKVEFPVAAIGAAVPGAAEEGGTMMHVEHH